MKHRFKIMSAFITFIFILSLSACGSTTISGNVTDSGKKANANGTIIEDTASEESPYEMGSTNGGTYTNNFVGIGCELDENWTFYTDKQLIELSGILEDAIGDEQLAETYAKSMENGNLVYDMCAVSTDGLAIINVVIENLGVLYGASMDENDYIEKSLDNLKKMLESSGMLNIGIEKASIEFAGATRSGFEISGEKSEVPIYEKAVCIKKGNYMATITVCSYYEDITDNLTSLFYSL